MKRSAGLTTDFLNLSLFGSVARGQADKFSDHDIVAIVRDGGGKQSEELVLGWAAQSGIEEPSISWYGEEKMREFFHSGDLFAWHLFLESVPLSGFDHIRSMFGEPAEFDDAITTIIELEEILIEVPKRVEIAPQTHRFEMGVSYVCLRNIAMAASWNLCERPDFGRYSPYAIKAPVFPCPREDYEALAACRIAGQRGTELSIDRKVDLEVLVVNVLPWIDELKRTVDAT
jgi:hypothetical protein